MSEENDNQIYNITIQDDNAKSINDSAPLIESNKNLDELFAIALSGRLASLKPEVKIITLRELNKIEFTQHKEYRLTEEQYRQWPKIYSISLNSENKQEVTFEFRNNSNLNLIMNILHYYSATFTVKEYSTRVSSEKTIVTRLITIHDNSYLVLAHLRNIYSSMSKEAGDLIWEALKYVTEDYMNVNSKWKDTFHYQLSAWADSVKDEDHIDFSGNDEVYLAKMHYNQLSDIQKTKFFKSIISYHVTLASQMLVNMVASYNPSRMERAFDSSNKTLLYIKNNLPTEAQEYAAFMRNKTETSLVIRFEPTFWDKLTSYDGTKHIKVGGTGVAAALTISDKLGLISKNIPGIRETLLVIDFSKVFLALLYAQDKTSDESEKTLQEIDITDLSHTFSDVITVCNHRSLLSLTENSRDTLVEFYASFIYSVIKLERPKHQYIDANFLLKQLSNQTYIETELKLKTQSITLLYSDDNSVSLFEFINNFNVTACYDSLQIGLVGENGTSCLDIEEYNINTTT